MSDEPAAIAPLAGDLDVGAQSQAQGLNPGRRIGDVVVSTTLGLMLSPLALLLGVLIWSTSKGPAIYWSTRVGRGGNPFRMPKFRTMHVGTPELPTDRMLLPDVHTTPVGRILRKLSLDELPQLWSVLIGDMSLVGPRPALPTQTTLNASRQAHGIHSLRPGITGWAQVNGRDDIAESRKIELDAEYLERHSFLMDMHILWLTVWRVVRSQGVKH